MLRIIYQASRSLGKEQEQKTFKECAIIYAMVYLEELRQYLNKNYTKTELVVHRPTISSLKSLCLKEFMKLSEIFKNESYIQIELSKILSNFYLEEGDLMLSIHYFSQYAKTHLKFLREESQLNPASNPDSNNITILESPMKSKYITEFLIQAQLGWMKERLGDFENSKKIFQYINQNLQDFLKNFTHFYQEGQKRKCIVIYNSLKYFKEYPIFFKQLESFAFMGNIFDGNQILEKVQEITQTLENRLIFKKITEDECYVLIVGYLSIARFYCVNQKPHKAQSNKLKIKK